MKGYFGPIEETTLKNEHFRKVLHTGRFCQLVVMCLRPGEEIGREMHPDVDQFFRLEEGEAQFSLEGEAEFVAHGSDAVIVPAGTYHNVLNTSKTEMLRLYTLYSPPNHPPGTIHKNKAEAEAAEAQAGH